MSEWKAINAACTDMCPQKELRLRSQERLLHRYEHGRFHPVKEYSRPAAGASTPSSQDVRTPETLECTVEYLVKRVFSQEEEPLPLVYDFVFDRFRAVRQDMVLQGLEDKTACRILTSMVRFHVISGALLSSYPIQQFDPEINKSHLLECIKTLLILQDKNRVEGVNAEEMAAVYILSNLSSEAPVLWALSLGNGLRRSALVVQSVQLALLSRQNNFVRFFRNISCLPPLLQMAARPFIQKLQLTALKIYSVAYHSPNTKYPAPLLAELLRLQLSDLLSLCSAAQVVCTREHVRFQKTDVSNIVELSTKAPLVELVRTEDKVDRLSVLLESRLSLEK